MKIPFLRNETQTGIWRIIILLKVCVLGRVRIPTSPPKIPFLLNYNWYSIYVQFLSFLIQIIFTIQEQLIFYVLYLISSSKRIRIYLLLFTSLLPCIRTVKNIVNGKVTLWSYHTFKNKLV